MNSRKYLWNKFKELEFHGQYKNSFMMRPIELDRLTHEQIDYIIENVLKHDWIVVPNTIPGKSFGCFWICNNYKEFMPGGKYDGVKPKRDWSAEREARIEATKPTSKRVSYL